MNEKIAYTDRPTIASIQVLRAFAFLGVLVSHADIRRFYRAGKWGVSIFFVLSGFMMTYRYYEKGRIESTSIKNNISFAMNKIRRLYPLHVVTTFVMIVSMPACNTVVAGVKLMIRLILNLLLIQEWFPINLRSINGVSWYLCVTVFLYFLFPWVLQYMEKNYCTDKAKRMIVALFGLQIMSGWFCNFMNTVLKMGIDLDWIVYKFPPMRVLDFVIGCNAGYLFLKDDLGKMLKKGTTFEMVMWIPVIAALIYCIAPYKGGIQTFGIYSRQAGGHFQSYLQLVPVMLSICLQ